MESPLSKPTNHPKFPRGPRSARPFLKWAGGKQRLLTQYEPHFPQKFRRYFEPFVGSGAVFFHLWITNRLPAEVFLYDINSELVNVYQVVRDGLDGLINQLSIHQEKHSKEYYYLIRALDREPQIRLKPVDRAARTIYLNRTCYNGLYRVNSKGQFNVPMGSYKNPNIVREKTLRSASIALQNAVIEKRDYQTITELAKPDDFIYFDPPYHPVSETANFTSYTAKDFGEQDQRRLARVYGELTEKGCLCMLSNSHTDLILGLYHGFRVETVQAGRAINSKANKRGPVDEVLVLNY